MSTALIELRSLQIGLPLCEWDRLTIGNIMDILAESGNDELEWPEVANQDDFEDWFVS